MNYELLKSKMDKFFSEATTEQLIQDLEDMGYRVYDAVYCEELLKDSTPISIDVNIMASLPSMSYKEVEDCTYVMAA